MIFNMIGGGGGSNPFAMVLVNYPQNSILTATNVDGFKDIFPSSSATPQRLYYVSQPSGTTQSCVFTITNGTKTATKTVDNIALASTRNVSINYRLPDEYQEVEFLQSTGTQYIITSLIPTTTINYSVRFQATHVQTGYDYMIAGVADPNYYIVYYGNPNTFRFYIGSNSVNTITQDTNIHTTSYNANTQKLTFDNVEYALTPGTATFDKPFYIFAYNYNNSPLGYAKAKLYSLIIDGHEFVSCYRKSDNVAGVWDVVNETFLTNSGSGTFIVGGDVN